MAHVDLDRIHKERISKLFDQDNVPDPENIFVSEKVVNTLPRSKFLIETLDKDKLLSVIPFTPQVYVELCPQCAKSADINTLLKLAEAGLAIPILTAPYSMYGGLTERVLAIDHISWFEYQAYRTLSLRMKNSRGLCDHCVEKRHRAMIRAVRGDRKAELYKDRASVLQANLYPYLFPDYEVLDNAVNACKRHDERALRQLVNLSYAVRRLRTSQAFGASTTVDYADFTGLDLNIDFEGGAAESGYAALSAEGLKLVMPTDIPIDQYIEIAKDYRPSITKAVEQILKKSRNANGRISLATLSRHVVALNNEIERVKGLKRYKLLEACVDFFDNKKAIVATALIASVLGVTGNLLGCGAAVASAGAMKIATGLRNKKKQNIPAQRLGRMIERDLRPHIDEVIARYVGTEAVAINVLSLRKKIRKDL